MLATGWSDLSKSASAHTACLTLRRTTLEEWRHVYETNVFGQIAVTQLLLPALREQGERSWILNISSYGGWRSSDLFSPYHTTKRALTGISRALSYELAHLGVHVVGVERA